jgi:hypothetical protein
LDRHRIRDAAAGNQLLDARIDDRRIELAVVEADDAADVAEVEGLDDAIRWRLGAVGFLRGVAEHRVCRVDARVDDRPGNLAALDLEERARRVPFHGGDRLLEGGRRDAIERDLPEERVFVRVRLRKSRDLLDFFLDRLEQIPELVDDRLRGLEAGNDVADPGPPS